ncbi:preprotein translocase subunit SecA, partial [Nocardia salmonicida]
EDGDEVIAKNGRSQIDTPRSGPLLQRWAGSTADAMRTIVVDHDGQWYVSSTLQHEAFHNAGVYAAFRGQFVKGELVAVHDWAGAYQPAPGRVKAALDELGIYDRVQHFDHHGTKHTDADSWPEAAPRRPSLDEETLESLRALRGDEAVEDKPDGPPRDLMAEAEDILAAYDPVEWGKRTPQELAEALAGSAKWAARDAEGMAEYHRAVTAATEVIRRGTTKYDADGAVIKDGKTMYATQVMGAMAMRNGPINMAAGEGKTMVFLADAMMKAAGGKNVHVFTTRDTLANDAMRLYEQVFKVLGDDSYNLVRMSPNGVVGSGNPDRATVFVGTLSDAGFGHLRNKKMAGDIAVIDEIDEALHYSDTTWIIADGPSDATPQVKERVEYAHEFLTAQLNSGGLTPEHFGRTPDQPSGPATMTKEGAEAVKELIEQDLPNATPKDVDDLLDRVQSAATARWEFVEGDHYVIGSDGKVYIIDQMTHAVMFDPKTSTESRWNGGLAQAIEAKHGIHIRGDSASSQSLTAKDMLGENYKSLTGASGTVAGLSDILVTKYGMSEVISIPRREESKLVTHDANTAVDQAGKHRAIAARVAAAYEAGKTPDGGNNALPHLIIANRNSEVSAISKLLESMGIARDRFESIDAEWMVGRGENWERDLADILATAGERGKILVINRQGGRGVDIEISPKVAEDGGLQVKISGKSEFRDIDVQAESRAARNGQDGSVEYFLSADDALFAKSPHHAITITRYTDAVTAHEDAVTAAGVTKKALDDATDQDRPDAEAAHAVAVRDLADALATRRNVETEIVALATTLQADNARRTLLDNGVVPALAGPVDGRIELTDTASRERRVPPPDSEHQLDDTADRDRRSTVDDSVGAERVVLTSIDGVEAPENRVWERASKPGVGGLLEVLERGQRLTEPDATRVAAFEVSRADDGSVATMSERLAAGASALSLNLDVHHPDGSVTRLRHGNDDDPAIVLFAERDADGHLWSAVVPRQAAAQSMSEIAPGLEPSATDLGAAAFTTMALAPHQIVIDAATGRWVTPFGLPAQTGWGQLNSPRTRRANVAVTTDGRTYLLPGDATGDPSRWQPALDEVGASTLLQLEIHDGITYTAVDEFFGRAQNRARIDQALDRWAAQGLHVHADFHQLMMDLTSLSTEQFAALEEPGGWHAVGHIGRPAVAGLRRLDADGQVPVVRSSPALSEQVTDRRARAAADRTRSIERKLAVDGSIPFVEIGAFAVDTDILFSRNRATSLAPQLRSREDGAG